MNIWTPGGGHVVALAPGPGDLFVLTTVAGRKVLLHPVEQFGYAVKLAEAAAIRMAPVPVTIKVLSLTLAEGQAFGLIPADLGKDETPEQEAETRQLVVKTLWKLVQHGSEAKVRSDAWRMLQELGEVK